MTATRPGLLPHPEFREEDYFIRHGVPEFMTPGEYGPLACGCYLVALEIDPLGPRMCLVMQRRDGAEHDHTLDDFAALVGAS